MKREIESSSLISGMERGDYEAWQTMMGWREKKLQEASVNGSVESLKQLMQEDPLTLARASITCFSETPLHIAAMLGHLDFAQLLLHHKSDFTSELDLQGRSPLHLASANGYVEIVKILLVKNVDACFIRDENGRTPLHLAVLKGRIHVIKELLVIGTDTGHGFLNIKDNDGNTVLHIAAALKRSEIIKYLLSEAGMDVNAVNENGFTALDIIKHTPRDLICMEIRESLLNTGALRAKNEASQTIGNSEFVAPIPRRPPSRSNSIKVQLKHHEDWLSKKRDSLMIAASVVAAMAYQAGLSPPGGVWNDDQKDSTGTITYLAGTSIMAANNSDYYGRYWVCNTICFVASLSTIFLLVSGVPLKRRIFMWILMMTMWVTLTFMAMTYLFSMSAISPGLDEFDTISTVCGLVRIIWLVLIGVVFLAHAVRFIIWAVRKVRKCMKKRLSSSADQV